MDTQLFVSTTTISRGRFEPIKNRGLVKPYGGLWTSTWEGESSAWVRWASDNYKTLYRRQWWLIEPDPVARICTIETYEDLRGLVARYPAGHFSEYLDFETMAREFDAIHLTKKGQRATHFTFPESLYGWDCESTLWFRWSFLSAAALQYH